MNEEAKEMLLAVADRIEKLPHIGDTTWNGAGDAFSMSQWTKKLSCGTCHCIGGWLQHDLRQRDGINITVVDVADRLQISKDDFVTLCVPDYRIITDWFAIKPAVASACIRHYVATGVVDWPRAFEAAGVPFPRKWNEYAE